MPVVMEPSFARSNSEAPLGMLYVQGPDKAMIQRARVVISGTTGKVSIRDLTESVVPAVLQPGSKMTDNDDMESTS